MDRGTSVHLCSSRQWSRGPVQTPKGSTVVPVGVSVDPRATRAVALGIRELSTTVAVQYSMAQYITNLHLTAQPLLA